MFTRPGHIFPLRYHEGGVLKRAGHTEASVGYFPSCNFVLILLDLCRLAGLQPAAIICELVRDEDGLMARRDDCAAFAKQHGFKLITIASLVDYLKKTTHQNGDYRR